MEYIDILDSKGCFTGKRKLRSFIHQNGDWHKTVHIWIINSKKEILIQKRSCNKDLYPNMWDISVAGHIKAGEGSKDAAVSEIKEELDVEIDKKDLTYIFTVKTKAVLKRGIFIDNEVSDVYLVRCDIDIEKRFFPNREVSEVKFISVTKLRRSVSKKDSDFVPHDEEYEKLFSFLEKI